MTKFLRFSFYSDTTGSLLVSMLVSIGIILAMITVSIPFFRQYQPSMELSATARALTTDLRSAQQFTIAEQIPYLVEFNLALNNYQIIKSGAATTTIKTVDLPAGITLQSVTGFTGNLVRFNSYGAVSESGDIILDNTGGQTKTISVKPSGYVQLAQ